MFRWTSLSTFLSGFLPFNSTSETHHWICGTLLDPLCADHFTRSLGVCIGSYIALPVYRSSDASRWSFQNIFLVFSVEFMIVYAMKSNWAWFNGVPLGCHSGISQIYITTKCYIFRYPHPVPALQNDFARILCSIWVVEIHFSKH